MVELKNVPPNDYGTNLGRGGKTSG